MTTNKTDNRNKNVRTDLMDESVMLTKEEAIRHDRIFMNELLGNVRG